MEYFKLPFKIQVPFKAKLAVLGLTASFALISLLAAFLRKRTKNKEINDRKKYQSELQKERLRTGRIPLPNSPNGGLNLLTYLCNIQEYST